MKLYFNFFFAIENCVASLSIKQYNVCKQNKNSKDFYFIVSISAPDSKDQTIQLIV